MSPPHHHYCCPPAASSACDWAVSARLDSVVISCTRAVAARFPTFLKTTKVLQSGNNDVIVQGMITRVPAFRFTSLAACWCHTS